MTEPVKPNEIGKAKRTVIPDTIIKIFNEFIAKNWNGHSATIIQDDIVPIICSKMGVARSHVFNEGWLNIESIYQDAGWSVKYEKPGYNERGRATFEFRKK